MALRLLLRRSRPLLALLALPLIGALAACRQQAPRDEEARAPAAASVVTEFPDCDTSQLTTREKRDFVALMGEVLAPCATQPVSLATCLVEKRPCAGCLPAARFLVEQFVAGGTVTTAEQAYRTRFAPDAVRAVSVAGAPSRGPEDAKIVVVEWADFQCPACRELAPALDALLAANSSDVRLVFKQYPLSIHPQAELAARAAVAAQKQGKFWEMHHELFAPGAELDRAGLIALARRLGLDEPRFVLDLDGEAVADAVARDRREADALGLKGTPMVFINGREVSSGTDLAQWIALEKQLLGVAPGAPAAPAAPATPGAPGAVPSGAAASPSGAPPAGSAPR